MNLKEIGKGILCGVLFSSCFFWSLALAFWALKVGEPFSSIALLACPLLTNAILGVLLAADRDIKILYEWLVSLPVAVATFFCYREAGFVYYWVNRIDPGYGRLSAGAGFAATAYLVLFCLCFLLAAWIAVMLTKRRNRRKSERPDGAASGAGGPPFPMG